MVSGTVSSGEEEVKLRLAPPGGGTTKDEGGRGGQVPAGHTLTLSRLEHPKVEWSVRGSGELLGSRCPAQGRCPSGGTGEVPPGPSPCRDPLRAWRVTVIVWLEFITHTTSFHSKNPKGRRPLPAPFTETPCHGQGGKLGKLLFPVWRAGLPTRDPPRS